jgi:hypothetical protein
MRRLTLAALATVATAALAAALLAAPSGAQTQTRVIRLVNFPAVPNADGFIFVGSEGEGLLSCAGAYPNSGNQMVAQVITRHPAPGTYFIRVLNHKGFIIKGITVRLNCVEDMVFTEAGQASQPLKVSTPTRAQVTALNR